MIAETLPSLLSAMLAVTKEMGGARPWWRGQSVCDWNLVPSVHHRGVSENEQNLTFRFRSMARSRHVTCPPKDDLSAWLFLMQHYGLPTRLLDWSDSALTALYFAVEDSQYDKQDAALWALHPVRLNKNQLDNATIFAADHPTVLPILKPAFIPVDKPVEKIAAVLTDQSDIRQLVQQSVFTANGTSTPINELPDADQFVRMIRIPGKAKPGFREGLDFLGISRATLFPDLANLARELSGRAFVKNA